MKIDLNSIDRKNFIVEPKIFNGEYVYLVIPQHIGCQWDKDNLHFRSSVWNAEGELISASFPKFFNWGEKSNLCTPPETLKGCVIPEKIDGSTLIVSKYKGNFMVRTRGTIDARAMEKNGFEVDILLAKYPKIQELYSDYDTWGFSLIFEWVSPLNQIVIKYDEPDLYLIGAINHGSPLCKDYELWPQDALDNLGATLGVKRPSMLSCDDDLELFLLSVGAKKDIEGYVVYFNRGQSMLKVKSLWYLALHRMKSELSSIKGVVEYYFTLDPCALLNYSEFYTEIATKFDHEIAEMCRGHISHLMDAIKESKKVTSHMAKFVEPLKKLSRKDAAIAIMKAYGDSGRSGMAFTMLDGKELTVDQKKKLVYQFLPK